jgi:hypothetical protein
MSSKEKIHGLGKLLIDAVEHGSRAIERVHKETAARPAELLQQILQLTEPVKLVHGAHMAAVTGVYAAIRGVNKVVEIALDTVAGDKS